MMALAERIENGTQGAPITNTSAQHAAEHILVAMRKGRGGEGFIEEMEATGQAELVKANGTRLPADGTINEGRLGQEPFDWSSIGVKIGKPVSGDEIWVEAQLPDGWKLDGTGHAMWSNLLDDKGRKRAQIFYKAAFYDRSCSISPIRRYSAGSTSVGEDYNGPYFATISDNGEEIHRFGPFDKETEPRPGSGYRLSGGELADEAARAYLLENYPDYLDPAAYWD